MEIPEPLPGKIAWNHATTILIVDDDEASRYLIKSWFSGGQFALIETSSAIEGLTLVLNKFPDLVILDLNMPGMHGFEFLRVVKDNPQTAHIPVIVNTSTVLEENEQRFLKTRAAAVLSKANTAPEDAMQMVTSVLSAQKQSR
jgi:CheY-like chemotaxis protein